MRGYGPMRRGHWGRPIRPPWFRGRWWLGPRWGWWLGPRWGCCILRLALPLLIAAGILLLTKLHEYGFFQSLSSSYLSVPNCLHIF